MIWGIDYIILRESMHMVRRVLITVGATNTKRPDQIEISPLDATLGKMLD